MCARPLPAEPGAEEDAAIAAMATGYEDLLEGCYSDHVRRQQAPSPAWSEPEHVEQVGGGWRACLNAYVAGRWCFLHV